MVVVGVWMQQGPPLGLVKEVCDCRTTRVQHLAKLCSRRAKSSMQRVCAL